ncbi:hypothetical protein MXD61_20100 [Frankia sp. AgPm24]|uniref:hypothetical protein n=1 Tax=Frankia sp. AgPm24 TaxID=631128 RepID=UPI00200FB37B|nr:hypothetical protein [Frankia sp. AgPm24]MCK9924141.1 hypothetical protein [Frankia sp. AgPm24]
MQDVEVPAQVDIASERGARPVGLLGARELRPVVVIVAFVVAIVLGLGIGFATADRDHSAGDTATGQTPAAELSPVQGTPSWAATRSPGAAHQMVLNSEPNPAALRLALQFTVAAEIKETDPSTTVTAAQVTVVEGMYFGAVEGVDAAQDQYWAIGRINVAGAASPPADPHVWRRIGSGPWTIVSHGAGACDSIPKALVDVWKGSLQPCIGA